MNSPIEYTYNVFISYRRHTAVEVWVEKYLYPELMKWLPEELAPDCPANIFFDKKIKPGKKWPAKLRQALKCSRILLPVLNSSYFGSTWCLAELDTILAREKLLGLSCEEQTEGLVYPIVFSDGKFFREDISQIQYCDMRKWASIADAFKSSKEFLGFESEVKQIARDIALMLDDSPPFDPGWPVIEAENQPTHPASSMGVPRFGSGGNT